MIRVDAVWLACEPLDMRAGTESALGRVVTVFGEARFHHAYLFANGLEPYAYLKDVLERLPTQPASAMTELLPYRWSAAA